jgi:signal transduction histidine kinase
MADDRERDGEELTRLRKRLERERHARQEAEQLAEQGTRQLYERQHELELLNTIADAANGAPTTREAIQITLNEICAYTGWPVGHAYLLGDDPGLLVSARIWHLEQPEKFSPFREISESFSFRAGEGLPGRVWQTRQPLWIPDVSVDANFPRAQHSAPIGVRAAFAFPVLAGSTVVAVLEFFSAEQIEAQETWLEIASQAGIQLGRIFERQQAITELEKVHLELLGRSNDLKKTIAELEAFSYSLSHDLRAPLRAINSFVQIFMEDYGSNVDPKGIAVLQRVVGSTQKMDQMVLDLLSFTRLSHEPMQIEALNTEELIQGIVRDRAEFQAPRAMITIESPLQKVMGNSASLTQCLTNLLDNAVKFVALGTKPEVRIYSEDAGPLTRLYVQDNGVGISPGSQPQMFRMFHRFHGKDYPGTGIGLAIVRKAVERMNGTVGVDSQPGHGTRFWLELRKA